MHVEQRVEDHEALGDEGAFGMKFARPAHDGPVEDHAADKIIGVVGVVPTDPMVAAVIVRVTEVVPPEVQRLAFEQGGQGPHGVRVDLRRKKDFGPRVAVREAQGQFITADADLVGGCGAGFNRGAKPETVQGCLPIRMFREDGGAICFNGYFAVRRPPQRDAAVACQAIGTDSLGGFAREIFHQVRGSRAAPFILHRIIRVPGGAQGEINV